MRNELRQATVHITALGRDVAIREPSWGQMAEIMQAVEGDSMKGGLLMVKHGVPEFALESLETLADNLSIAAVSELAEAVGRLAGTGKNFESVPGDDSHSG